MKRAAQYHTQARELLKGRYKLLVLASLLSQCITFMVTLVPSLVSGFLSRSLVLGHRFSLDWSSLFAGTAAVLGLTTVFVIFYFIDIVLSVILGAGHIRLVMRAVDQEEASLGDLFFGFRRGLFIKMLAASAIMGAIILGVSVPAFLIMAVISLLLAAGGLGVLVIAAMVVMNLLLVAAFVFVYLSIGMFLFVLVDEPWRGPWEAICVCWQMMKGRRWKLFCLECSFAGWLLLIYLSVGIGTLWAAPYILCANMLFYRDMVKEDSGFGRPVFQNGEDFRE